MKTQLFSFLIGVSTMATAQAIGQSPVPPSAPSVPVPAYVPKDMPPDLIAYYVSEGSAGEYDWLSESDTETQRGRRFSRYVADHWREMIEGWELAKPDHTQVHLLSVASQFLPPDEYLRCTSRLIQACRQGHFGLRLLRDIMFPWGAKYHFFNFNFWHPEVRRVVKEYRATFPPSKGFDGAREECDEVLRGSRCIKDDWSTGWIVVPEVMPLPWSWWVMGTLILLAFIGWIRRRRRLKREEASLLAKRREAAGLLSLASLLALSAMAQEVTVPATMPPELREFYHRQPAFDPTRPESEIPEMEARLSEYSRAHWRELMQGWRSGAANEREQYWVVVGAEYLPGKEYVLFLDLMLREVESGRMPLEATNRAFSGVGYLKPGKTGFVQNNLLHPDIRNLLKRVLAIIDQKTVSEQTHIERRMRWFISDDLSRTGESSIPSAGEAIEKLDKKVVQLPPLPPAIENIDLKAFSPEFKTIWKVPPKPPSMRGRDDLQPTEPDEEQSTGRRRGPEDEPSLILPVTLTVLSGIALLMLFIRAIRRLG